MRIITSLVLFSLSAALCASLVLLSLSAAPAFAGAAEAKTCAASLDANGQLIFNTVFNDISAMTTNTTTSDFHRLLNTRLVSLVTSGQVPKSAYRQAGAAAAPCLFMACTAGSICSLLIRQ